MAGPGEHPDVRFGTRALLAAVALALVAVPFALLTLLVRDNWGPLHRLDIGSSTGLHRYARSHPAFVTAMRWLSDSGSTVAWAIALTLAAGWLLWRGRRRLAAFVAVVAVTSPLLNLVVKSAVDRARPVLPDPVAVAVGFSFPSGHAQAAIVGYSVLWLVLLSGAGRAARWIGGVVALVMVVSIGFSRIALGVHYLSDVVAGYVLGAAWVAAMVAVFSAWQIERGRRPGITAAAIAAGSRTEPTSA